VNHVRERIDELIRSRKLNWERAGSSVKVQLGQSGRSQRVHIRREGDIYIFRSVVVGSEYVTRTNSVWRETARRAWRKNGLKDLITFAFDERDRLVGRIEQPVATLDHEELELYVDVLAKECDRFEYVITGKDRE